MMASYVIVMILTLFLFSIYLLSTYRSYFYENERVNLFAKANIVSSIITENGIENTRSLTNATRDLFSDSPARLMVLSKQAVVIYDNDSQNSFVNKFFIKDTIKSALSGETNSSIFENPDGSNSIDVCIPVKDEEGETLGIVYLRKSLSSADEFLKDISSVIYRMGMIMALVIALVSIVISGIITKPLTKLTAITKEIAKGNFNQRADVKGHDEISNLAMSVNSMTEQLSAVEESRRQFVSDVSHELKTPLATIKLLSESILQSQAFDEDMVREFLGDMTNEVDRLTRIVERLLTLTKNDSQVSKIEFKTVDLTKLIDMACRKLRPLANEKNITLTYHRESEDKTIEMLLDGDKIYEAVYNIADNSIKYTPEGGSVDIRLFSDITSVMIEIEDTGIGIPKEDTSHIFDRFYRVDKARARETGGTGLGLSIASEAVSQHGGHIEVISEEGEGSKFIIILPYSGK